MAIFTGQLQVLDAVLLQVYNAVSLQVNNVVSVQVYDVVSLQVWIEAKNQWLAKTSIDATPSGNLTFLLLAFGKPSTANGLGNWFRERCNEAKLPH